ncbi:hypothetical protein [Streptomyces apocyni]|uniref:hypothetical protein n=1 Tax=Streptomyces apocyni TaxID=2654677 RepID=UPI0012EA5476|nr:hypothetical protein [Streptomyces apocyni]
MGTATRLLTGTALAAAAACLCATPALAADPAALEIDPPRATPGTEVTANTTACGAGGTAAGDASAVGAGAFKLAPSTHQEDAVGQFKIPTSATPGTYAIRAKCVTGREVSGDLVVTLTAPAQVTPKGHVKTGVGGALGPDPVKTAAGVAALAVAAAGGTWLLHRRARGDGI